MTQKERLLLFFIACIALLTCPRAIAKPITIHPSNFFLLEFNQKLLYPVGANAGYLLNLDRSDEQIKVQIKHLSDVGFNTIRLCVDHAQQSGKPVKEQPDGTLSEMLMERVKRICTFASEHNLVVVISFFDIQRMAEDWSSHAYNQANGGVCKTPVDFFTLTKRRSMSSSRIKQIVQQLQMHENVIWEIARGINIDEKSGFGDSEFRLSIIQWTLIMLDLIRRNDERNHLTALSFLPNTIPSDLMGLPDIDILFLHIRSNELFRAVKSSSQLIQLVRQNKKPVFIGELSWSGKPDQQEQYSQWMLWCSLAASSSAFLNDGDIHSGAVSDSTLSIVRGFDFAVPMIDISGKPRPPADPAPKLFPEDSYELIHHVTGYDWLFCILRNTPGNDTANIDFSTPPGWYDYQWFHIENTQMLPNKSRRNIRTTFRLQSPEFEQIIFGRLRYIRPLKPAKDENQSADEKKSVQ